MDWMKEERLAKSWLDGHYYSEMEVAKLAQLVKQGFTKCDDEDTCTSVSVCGSDSCACVRSIFPHPDYYNAYKLMRAELLEYELLTELSDMDIRKNTYGKNERGDNSQG